MSSPGAENANVPGVFWLLLGLGIVLPAEAVALFAIQVFHLSGVFAIYAPVSALLAGLPLWWILIVLPGRATYTRGLLVGVLGCVLAHPLVFTMAAITPQASSLSPDKVIPLTIFSLIFLGCITLPAGAGIGVLLIKLQYTLMQRRWPQALAGEP